MEKQIKISFEEVDLQTDSFSSKEQEYIIFWLELIDYKFQALNLRRKFLRFKTGEFIPYLSDIPLAIMENQASISPPEVRERVINSLNRLITKTKKVNRNSLLVFRTKNPELHFFHNINDYIFIELPRFGVAVFLFLEKEFKEHKKAYKEAIKNIEGFINSI